MKATELDKLLLEKSMTKEVIMTSMCGKNERDAVTVTKVENGYATITTPCNKKGRKTKFDKRKLKVVNGVTFFKLNATNYMLSAIMHVRYSSDFGLTIDAHYAEGETLSVVAELTQRGETVTSKLLGDQLEDLSADDVIAELMRQLWEAQSKPAN